MFKENVKPISQYLYSTKHYWVLNLYNKYKIKWNYYYYLIIKRNIWPSKNAQIEYINL